MRSWVPKNGLRAPPIVRVAFWTDLALTKLFLFAVPLHSPIALILQIENVFMLFYAKPIFRIYHCLEYSYNEGDKH